MATQYWMYYFVISVWIAGITIQVSMHKYVMICASHPDSLALSYSQLIHINTHNIWRNPYFVLANISSVLYTRCSNWVRSNIFHCLQCKSQCIQPNSMNIEISADFFPCLCTLLCSIVIPETLGISPNHIIM